MRRALIPGVAALVLPGIAGAFLRWLFQEEPGSGWVVSPADRDACLADPARVNAELQLRLVPGREAGSVERLVVEHVSPRGPAHAAGLRKGDVGVSLNGRPVTTMGRALNLASEIRGAQALDVVLDRGGVPVELKVEFR